MADQGATSTTLLAPEECFKVLADPDYLAGYSLEFTADTGGIKWGAINWYKDIECEPMEIVASDVVTDICELFDDEVTHALSEGWATPTFTEAGGFYTGWNLGRGAAADADASPAARQFATLWFDDNLDGKPTDEKLTGDAKPSLQGTSGKLNDIYAAAAEGENIDTVQFSLVDEDDDPTSDFGKIDLVDDDETDGPDGKADQPAFVGEGAQNDVQACSMDDNGADQKEACDSMIDMTFDLMFWSGTYGCEASRSVTVTCEWDSQAADLTADDLGAGVDAMKCEAETND